jgi:hypothetical protein
VHLIGWVILACAGAVALAFVAAAVYWLILLFRGGTP